MDEDFYYAFLTGWLILFIFWIMTILFIYFRKPPNSKLTSKIALYSVGLFAVTLSLLIIFGNIDSFSNI